MPVSTECAAALLSFRYPSYNIVEWPKEERRIFDVYYMRPRETLTIFTRKLFEKIKMIKNFYLQKEKNLHTILFRQAMQILALI